MSMKCVEVIIYHFNVYLIMTNIKTQLIDRMFKKELDTFSEFVKVFPSDGHEPDQSGFIFSSRILRERLDNDGTNDNSLLVIPRDVDNGIKYFEFNLATLLAFAKFGFEKAVELKQ